MRSLAFAFAMVTLGCSGCTTSGAALWPGPDWRTPVPPAAAVRSEPAPDETAPRDDTPTRRPRTLTRRGSSTPPDLLFPNPQAERRPQGVQPASPPPVTLVEPRNDVLAPRDPKAPYSADGSGYQRQGTTIVGPTGNTYNMTGSSIFGPGGRTCTAVGTSLFCN